MGKLRLTLACGDYDRTRPLKDGDVQVDGVDLNYLALTTEETFFRQLKYQEFDASEMSLSNYTILRSRGDDTFTAIPAFVSRAFRHNSIVVNTDSGIQRPEDLRGKRFGVPEFHMTAAVWVRGMLRDEYGVGAEDVHWVTGGLEEPGRVDRSGLAPPTGVHVEPAGAGRTLNELLANGDIDAVTSPRVPSSFRKGHPKLRRLFPNFREVERAYFEKTGIFPIMHCVVIKTELYRTNRWLAASLYKAFLRSKDLAYERLGRTGVTEYSMMWSVAEFEEERSLTNGDPWPYGVAASRRTLDSLVEYSFREGASARKVAVEELFAEETFEQFRH